MSKLKVDADIMKSEITLTNLDTQEKRLAKKSEWEAVFVCAGLSTEQVYDKTTFNLIGKIFYTAATRSRMLSGLWQHSSNQELTIDEGEFLNYGKRSVGKKIGM